MALLVIGNWLLGDAMDEVFDAREDGEAFADAELAFLHIAVGLSVLVLMLIRLAIRIRRPVQIDPEDPHRLLTIIGEVNHWAFYALLITIPLLGAAAWFGRSEDAGELHEGLVNVTRLLVLLHGAAALFHQAVLRDGLIGRMLRPGKGP